MCLEFRALITTLAVVLVSLSVSLTAHSQQPARSGAITLENCRPGGSRYRDAVARVRGSAAARPNLAQFYAIQEMVEKCWMNQADHGLNLAEIGRPIIFASIESQSRWGTLDQQRSATLIADYLRFTRNSPSANIYVRSMLAVSATSRERERRSCSPTVNLGNRFGPSRNQGRTGWCFAFAAAELLSFRSGFQVSASDAALNVFNKGGPETVEAQDGIMRFLEGRAESSASGGTVLAALDATLERGLCRESAFNSSDSGIDGFRGALNRIEAIRRRPLVELQGACERDLRYVNAIFPALDIADINAAMRTSVDSSFLSRLGTEACRPRTRLTGVTPRRLLTTNRDSRPVFAEIERQLSAGRPAAIGLSADILADSRSTSTIEDHGVTVIGRRFNAERSQCEYLIRNSAGPDCGRFASAWTCDDATKGHAWVSKEAISRSISDATWLE